MLETIEFLKNALLIGLYGLGTVILWDFVLSIAKEILKALFKKTK